MFAKYQLTKIKPYHRFGGAVKSRVYAITNDDDLTNVFN